MVFALLAAVTAASSDVKLGVIHAQLYYLDTGRLSDDVLSRPKPFIYWNTIIGEGDAEEAADDLLITVQLNGEKFGRPEDNQKLITDPVRLTATNEKGKVVATRTFTNMLLSVRGSTTLPLWLRDITCESITVKATFRDQMTTAHLKMACGE